MRNLLKLQELILVTRQAATCGVYKAVRMTQAVRALAQPDKWQDLERVLTGATDKPHVILLGGHPDPDSIGSALAHKTRPHAVVIRSTLLPGTTARLILPELERVSGKRHGAGFTLSYNPEFLRAKGLPTPPWLDR